MRAFPEHVCVFRTCVHSSYVSVCVRACRGQAVIVRGDVEGRGGGGGGGVGY